MTPRRLHRFAILAAVVVGALGPGSVAAHAPDPALSGGAMEQDLELTFRWRSGAVPPSAHRTAILAAAADIGESRASRAALFRFDVDATNPIGYGNGATCSPAGIACFTRTLPRSFTMWFRPQGYAFDWGTLKWCQSYSTWPNGCFDVENIALDEFAHIEGLAHHVNYSDDDDYLDAVVQTYSRAKPRDGYDAHVLARCDVATLQRLYDVQNSSQKYSTCLSLATSLTLTSSQTTVTYGSQTTLTAKLLVGDSSSYGLLRNNWVSNRTVKLQRRAAGTTTWMTLATMTPGSSATYTLSTTVTYDTEYRAVFSTPSDEGLRGDTSPTVTVKVSGCSRPPCPLVAPE